MFTTTLPANSSPVTMQNEAIEIREGNKNFRFALNEISKMCLRPCKNNSLCSLLGSMFSKQERMYHLCITTQDGREIQIRIKGHHKQAYIILIGQVRRNLRKAIKPASGIPPLPAIN